MDNVVFISDIRQPHDLKDEKKVDKIVREDMKMQQKWVKIMKPRLSMLKFRLPWNDEDFPYLDGEIRIQPWAGQTSTETRLVFEGVPKMKMYNCRQYEEQMFFHNVQQRVFLYPHDVTAEGLDHCYDCAAEVDIWNKVLEAGEEAVSNRIIGSKIDEVTTFLGHNTLG